jgi:hypothetical protein
MPNRAFGPWTGVDLRNTSDASDPKALLLGDNVDLETDGSIRERRGLRKVAVVDADSVGLYSVGGRLRCAMAAGHSKPASVQATVPIIYDMVGDGTIYALDSVVAVTSVSSWDADSALGIYPVIVIQRDTGEHEIHWVVDVPVPSVNGAPPPAYVPSNDPVDTKVDTPFTPGSTIHKIQEKMCAVDNTNGTVRFCSTVNGVADWTAEADAGFLPVIRHATGDRTIQGLSFYDGLLAVLFSDSVQLWEMHPDPALHRLVRVLSGPGVQYPGSAVNVRGDLFYLARGTFSSLRRSGVTGQLQDGDIGAPVAPGTKQLSGTAPLAVWSQSQSAYLCFFGTECWRYMVSPTSKTKGWTHYTLPVSVEAVTEHLGELYVRSGTDVYRFEAGYNDGSTFTVDTSPLDLDAPGKWKYITRVNVSGSGIAAIKCLPDFRDRALVDHVATIDGSTASLVDIPVLENSEAPSFRFTGTVGAGGEDNPFELHRFILDFNVGQTGI